MPKLKKIDFRNLEAPSVSQPSAPKEVKKGRSLNFSGEILSRMSKKAKIEAGALALVLLVSIGLVIVYFFI